MKKFTMSGTSCVGKTKIGKSLSSSAEINCREAISFTTRKRNARERDGVDYYFITKDEFEKLKSNDEIIEYNEYAGNYYGTLKSEAESQNSELVILSIEIIRSEK